MRYHQGLPVAGLRAGSWPQQAMIACLASGSSCSAAEASEKCVRCWSGQPDRSRDTGSPVTLCVASPDYQYNVMDYYNQRLL